jgi:hypothetical protein
MILGFIRFPRTLMRFRETSVKNWNKKTFGTIYKMIVIRIDFILIKALMTEIKC